MTEEFFQAIAPPRVVGFMILLPDPIPITQNATWFTPVDERVPELDRRVHVPAPGAQPIHAEEEGKNFVSLRFWQMKDDRPIPLAHDTELLHMAFKAMHPGANKDDDADELNLANILDVGERYRTVVEAVTFNSVEPSESTPIDRCLDVLMKFHRAYRMMADKPLPILTVKRILPTAYVFARLMEEDEVTFVGLHTFEQAVPDLGALSSEVSPELFDKVAGMQRRLDRYDPMARYYESRTEAGYSLHGIGSMRDAVMHLGIACEVLLDGLLGMLMWEDEITLPDAASVFRNFVAARIKTEYHTRLGGTWTIDSGPVGGWYTDVAAVRNRVVHAGYTPTEEEAKLAERAADALRDFMAQRLAAKSKSYPFTAVTFLGDTEYPGLPKLSRAAMDWVNQNRDRLDQLSDKHMAWRLGLNAEMEKVRP